MEIACTAQTARTLDKIAFYYLRYIASSGSIVAVASVFKSVVGSLQSPQR